ncbi:MAG: phosphoribosylamine--glycine ligase [Nitrospinae bacterium RIFCSPLOWO2_12_FULL_45_22]|nr:MAG: phosphoribosylamine--glycine ligase [Nitrospinae bacterium RIFCSPLOWO2_12_FULL_45_22]
MKVMVIGEGGREHALAWKIARSPLVTRVYCAPGNAGTALLGQNIPLKATNLETLKEFALKEGIDLTVVGPELPLAMGIVDEFQEVGLKVFGPNRKTTELESSKVFAKEVMTTGRIPTAPYKVINTFNEAIEYIEQAEQALVVKADGLAGGKGVIVCSSKAEAIAAAKSLMVDKIFADAGNRLVIEERLWGEEVSFLCLTDGEDILPLATSQDHKQIFDGDQGPNTGGMGAYSPAPVVTPAMFDRIVEEIAEPTIKTMAQLGRSYQGVLYIGLMIDQEGPKVLEYNARFGDPETQPLMLRLESDLVPLLKATITGQLKDCQIHWKPQASVCVVMAAQGYPGPYEKGKEITGIETAEALEDIEIFHAGTITKEGKIFTNGGRVLGVTSLGGDIAQAIERAYEGVKKIFWDGAYYRADIGQKALNRAYR